MAHDNPVTSQRSITVSDVEDIQYEITNGVGTITMDNPDKYNAMTFDMRDAIADAVQRASGDDRVKVIVLKGAGGNFCAGQDLSQVYKIYESYDGEEAGERRPSQRARLHYDSFWFEQFEEILYSLKPVIAQIEGWCIGAGTYVNAMTNLTIAAENAKLSHRESRLAGPILSPTVELELLELGPKAFNEFMLTGQTVSGKRAAQIGYVNEAVPEEDIDIAVDRYCEAIKKMPLDGIVMGQKRLNQAYETLGIGQMLSNSSMGHSFGTNIRFEPGETNFIGQRGKEDTSDAIKKLHEQYDDLGFNDPEVSASDQNDGQS